MCNEKEQPKEKFIEPYNRIRKDQFLKDLREDPEFRAQVKRILFPIIRPVSYQYNGDHD